MTWTLEKKLTLLTLRERGWTYSKLGKRYGITSQDAYSIIRKILENKPFIPYSYPVKGLMMIRNRKQKLRSGVSGIAEKSQELFEEECKKRFIPFEPKWRENNFDYLVNDKRVEVKTANINSSNRFTITFTKNIFDIMAFYLIQTDEWFLIPFEFFEGYAGGGYGGKIGNESYSKLKPYKDNWEILYAK